MCTFSRLVRQGQPCFCTRFRVVRNKRLSKRVTLTIPQRGAYLPLDRHVGREIVVAVSSRTPIRDLDDMLLSAEEIVAEGREI